MSFFIQVYGCQMNVYDSRRIVGSLLESGYNQTDDIDSANIIIFYTCNIREKAVSKLLSDIGRLKNPDKKIIAVGGCVAQALGSKIFSSCKYIDIVFGPQTYHNLPSYISAISNKKSKRVIDIELSQDKKFGCLPEKQEVSISEFVSIQEGCDNFCTYCVVPYTRGREYSRPALDIINETKELVKRGAQEITLLGQNVNSYRGDAAYISIGDTSRGKWSLERLLREVANIDGIKRLRYTTSHPKDFTTELMTIHSELIDIMPAYVHIPVQSGSDKILKLMNRGHTAKEYSDKIMKFRDICKGISFSSDFIVGFPYETDEDFFDTVKLAKEIGYSMYYAFKYSKRKGTPAFSMPNQIPENIKEERLKVLHNTLFESQLNFNRSCIGALQNILIEKRGKKDRQYIGKSLYMQSVVVESDTNIIGTFKNVVIKDAFQNSLFGDIVS